MATAGRFIYAIPFAIFGVMHFIAGGDMAGIVPIPGGIIWVWITGIALIAASLAIMTRKKAVLACQLLGVMLLSFAVLIHLMGVINAADQAAMQASMSNMLKDTALAGAAWFMSGHIGEAHAAATDATT